MYFENNTGDEKLDHWRKGISDLLTTDLTQSRYIKVLGGDRLFAILSQMDQLEAKSFSSEVLKQVADTRRSESHSQRELFESGRYFKNRHDAAGCAIGGADSRTKS